MKRFFICLLRCIVAHLLAFSLFYVFDAIVLHIIYPGVSEWFSIKELSPVSDKEAYNRRRIILSFIASAVAYFIIPIIEKAFDNSRFEYVIKKTEGLYKIKDAVPIYLKHYMIADLVAVTVTPLLFIPTALIRFPEKYEEYLSFLLIPFKPYLTICEIGGMIHAYFVVLIITLLAQIPAVIFSLRRWRALWLAEIE